MENVIKTIKLSSIETITHNVDEFLGEHCQYRVKEMRCRGNDLYVLMDFELYGKTLQTVTLVKTNYVVEECLIHSLREYMKRFQRTQKVSEAPKNIEINTLNDLDDDQCFNKVQQSNSYTEEDCTNHSKIPENTPKKCKLINGIREDQVESINRIKKEHNIVNDTTFNLYVKVWGEYSNINATTKKDLISLGEEPLDNFIKWVDWASSTNFLINNSNSLVIQKEVITGDLL